MPKKNINARNDVGADFRTIYDTILPPWTDEPMHILCINKLFSRIIRRQ